MVVPVSNKDIVSLLLNVTGKFVAYFVVFNLTSIISFSFDSHSKSKEKSSKGEKGFIGCVCWISSFIDFITIVMGFVFVSVWVGFAMVICTGVVVAVIRMRFAILMWLLKYFVIFPVASNNSAMWSGFLVESCKLGSLWSLIFFLLLLSMLWKGLVSSCLIRDVF